MVNNKNGFTILEVLLSVIILGVGIIGVYRPLLSAFNALNLVDRRIEVNELVTRELWDLQAKADQLGVMQKTQDKGEWMTGKSVYYYRVNAEPVFGNTRLYRARFQVAWNQGGYSKSFQRDGYVLVPEVNDEES